MNTYGDKNALYSVDMLIAWVNQYSPKRIKYDMRDVAPVMDSHLWADEKHSYSPNMVLKNSKKYKYDTERIHNAELKYPILIHNGYIVDGAHRLTKAFLEKRSSISVIEVPKEIMTLARLPKGKDWSNLHCYYILELYGKRFTEQAVKRGGCCKYNIDWSKIRGQGKK